MASQFLHEHIFFIDKPNNPEATALSAFFLNLSQRFSISCALNQPRVSYQAIRDHLCLDIYRHHAFCGCLSFLVETFTQVLALTSPGPVFCFLTTLVLPYEPTWHTEALSGSVSIIIYSSPASLIYHIISNVTF